MKQAHLIVVGKLKDKNLEAIEHDYLKRIKAFDFHIHELKSSSENKEQEGKLILQKMNELKSKGSIFSFVLTEFGKEYFSPEFSKLIFDKAENSGQLVFIIGGAEGFSHTVLNEVNSKLSLSKLTFPHKLARILFIEQFYRAITIKEGHPYHN